MRCPHCGARPDRQNGLDVVLNSRPNVDGTIVRRRRQCHGCDKRFTTHETVVGSDRQPEIAMEARRMALIAIAEAWKIVDGRLRGA